MEYRTLGRTSLSLSALSFGASSLGGVFHDLREAEGIRAGLPHPREILIQFFIQ